MPDRLRNFGEKKRVRAQLRDKLRNMGTAGTDAERVERVLYGD